MLVPTRIAVIGTRMVAGTNALMWNMREFSTNPIVSQQLQLISEYLRGINRGEGIGFFLLITDDENRSIKITPQLVKRVVPLLFCRVKKATRTPRP